MLFCLECFVTFLTTCLSSEVDASNFAVQRVNCCVCYSQLQPVWTLRTCASSFEHNNKTLLRFRGQLVRNLPAWLRFISFCDD